MIGCGVGLVTSRVLMSTDPSRWACHLSPVEQKGAAEVELDMSERRLLLTSAGRYHLDLRLPYPVDDEKGTAKFDKAKKTLTLIVPVKPPEPQAPPGACSE
jgi:dynein assembly factor 2, axonemal